MPSLGVYHENISALDTLLCSRMARGRAFAAIRSREQRFSLVRRIAYAAGAGALPVLMLWRIARRVMKDRALARQFLLVSPLVFLGAVAWSTGESAGYLSTAASRTPR